MFSLRSSVARGVSIALLCVAGGMMAAALGSGCGAALSLPGVPASIEGNASPPYDPSYYNLELARAKWRKSPVLYKIGTGSSKIVNFRALIDTGVAKWRPAMNPFVTFQEANDLQTPDIVINFVPSGDSHLGIDFSTGSQAIGYTHTQYDAASRTISAATCYCDENQDPETILAEITHEFGHALGIDVHSTAKGDIMYATLHSPVEVDARDWNTIRSIYDPVVNP